MSGAKHPLEKGVAIAALLAALPTAVLGGYMFLTTSNGGEWGGFFRFLGGVGLGLGGLTAFPSIVALRNRRFGFPFLAVCLLLWGAVFSLVRLIPIAMVIFFGAVYMFLQISGRLNPPDGP